MKRRLYVFLFVNLFIFATFLYGGNEEKNPLGVSEAFYKERFISESSIGDNGLIPWEVIDSEKDSSLVPWEIKERSRLVPSEEILIDGIELESEFFWVAYDVNANVDERRFALRELWLNGEYYDSSGYRFTYYSQEVLPGGGLDIPGRHVDGEGYVCDEVGYICLASIDLPKGTVIKIPFGDGFGKIYDECDISGTLDVYTR